MSDTNTVLAGEVTPGLSLWSRYTGQVTQRSIISTTQEESQSNLNHDKLRVLADVSANITQMDCTGSMKLKADK